MESTAPTVLEIINTVYVFAFVALLFASAAWATRRLDRYLRAGQRPPLLLWRDTALMLGLAFPFGGILVIRAFGITNTAQNPWWVIPSGGFAVLAMAVWAYFEFRVIERNRKGEDLWDPYAKPFGEVTERPWESPSRSASGPADTPTPPSAPLPGDGSEPPTWRRGR